MAGASLIVFAVSVLFRKKMRIDEMSEPVIDSRLLLCIRTIPWIIRKAIVAKIGENWRYRTQTINEFASFSKRTELERGRKNQREEIRKVLQKGQKMNRRIEFLSCVSGVSSPSSEFGRGSSDVACFRSDCGV